MTRGDAARAAAQLSFTRASSSSAHGVTAAPERSDVFRRALAYLRRPVSSEHSGVIDRALAYLARPVDCAWLAAFRVLFGAMLAVSLLRFLAYGWVDDFFVRPAFHFKYWGFEWIQPLSAAGMHALFWGLAAAALAVAVGLAFRWAAGVCVVGFTYLQLIDVTTYLNHYYLVCLLGLLLALSPAGKYWSVDAWLRSRPAPREVPRFWVVLFRFQVGVVYVFAGLAKAQSDWLWHAQPLNIWLSSRTDLPLIGPLLAQASAPLLMSWAGFLFDTTIVLWLLLKRTRPLAYLAVIVFHVVTRALFPIGMFPVIMIVSAQVFFSTDWPRRGYVELRALGRAAARRLGLNFGKRSETTPGAAAPPREVAITPARFTLGWRVGVGLAAAYALLQLALPLRYLAYGGNVLWHEQGMRFSWRVMVREKNGSVTYLVRNKRTGQIWEVNPRTYLTRYQEREMSAQPDLILQLAKHVQRDLETRLGTDVEVRVDAWASLNGRPRARLIDPNVDLTTLSDGLQVAHWILPAPAMPPPALHPL